MIDGNSGGNSGKAARKMAEKNPLKARNLNWNTYLEGICLKNAKVIFQAVKVGTLFGFVAVLTDVFGLGDMVYVIFNSATAFCFYVCLRAYFTLKKIHKTNCVESITLWELERLYRHLFLSGAYLLGVLSGVIIGLTTRSFF